ncbi:immunoglobulin-like domain-containing protein [Brevibacillus migulae]|uniref:immunoglobulin-like domain-containing protein n=1 Tax=Brevibacillus migulae TaxID=1644114 RepID=UPI00106E89DA|nr:immunoglobulin-like domain-containing protein [Brevibacillus migulae]
MHALKILLITVLAALFLMGCSQEAVDTNQALPKQSRHGELPSQLKNKEIHAEMHMDLPSGSSTFDQALLTINNEGPGTLIFGVAFTLEKKENGVWYEVPFKENLAFVEIALHLAPGDSHQDTIRNDMFPYSLAQGEYRIVKQLYLDGKEMILAAPFTIPGAP